MEEKITKLIIEYSKISNEIASLKKERLEEINQCSEKAFTHLTGCEKENYIHAPKNCLGIVYDMISNESRFDPNFDYDDFLFEFGCDHCIRSRELKKQISKLNSKLANIKSQFTKLGRKLAQKEQV